MNDVKALIFINVFFNSLLSLVIKQLSMNSIVIDFFFLLFWTPNSLHYVSIYLW